MAAEHVRTKLGYAFVDIGLLDFALTAADRRNKHSPSYDGNRGLASLGIRVIEMVHTLYTIVVVKGTKRDVSIHDHWFKTKTGQATACTKLGIDEFVNQSIRQQHEKPSSTVLSNALTAIFGAIWLDLGQANEGSSNACEQIFRILCRINNVIIDMSPTADERCPTAPEENEIHRSIPDKVSNTTTRNQSLDRLDASMMHCSGEIQHGPCSSSYSVFLPPHDMESGLNAALPVETEVHEQSASVVRFVDCMNGSISDAFGLPVHHVVVAQPEQRTQIDNGGMAGPHYRPSDTSRSLPTAVKARKSGHSSKHRGRPHNSTLHQRLVCEELEKLNGFSGSRRGDLEALLDHPRIAELSANPLHVGQLRLLYLGTGSCQSLAQFKESLRIARTKPNISINNNGPNLLPMERYRKICLYDIQEALSVLVRRYHVVKLFESELEILRQDNMMVVETPSNFGMNQSHAGNPAMMQEAALTDRLLYKVRSGLVEGSPEFKKVREELTQLRRLARRLQILIQRYGFGILPLLPCGPSYSDFSITDRTLISIPEGLFAQFSELLYQQQGIFLDKFSKAIEPALTALADGRLESSRLFPIEAAEVNGFRGLPMGSQEALDICLRGTPISMPDL